MLITVISDRPTSEVLSLSSHLLISSAVEGNLYRTFTYKLEFNYVEAGLATDIATLYKSPQYPRSSFVMDLHKKFQQVSE